MSTAHRPTWAPAKGGSQDAQSGSRVFVATKFASAKDQTAHTKLKFRQPGQSAPGELKEKDFKLALEEKERAAKRANITEFNEERVKDLLLLENGDAGGVAGASRPKALQPRALDADDEGAASSDEDSDEEDEEEELMAELERIRAERAAEAAKKAAEAEGAEASARREELLTGNPLLQATPASFQVKRRWDDDVVFRNQTRGEVKAAKRFVNDTIRNDFHRRFLTRYVR